MPAPKDRYRPYEKLHYPPHGAGDARPTAMQVLEDEGLIGDKLAGKVFLVTGCSAGLGLETARVLHETGADVYMTVRESKKVAGEKMVTDIRQASAGRGKLELIFMDLASFASIRAGAQDFLAKTTVLNVLILNAGIMMCPYSRTKEGFEMQMGTNHFGHFLLFQLLKNRLLESVNPGFNSRVVVVSSAGHRYEKIRFHDMGFGKEGYDRLKGYGQSKTANIYMANSIERHYGSRGLHATSVHPGGIMDTELGRYQDKDSIDADFGWDAMVPYMKTIPQGAATQVWAATAKYFNDRGGVYLGDLMECGPWQEEFSPVMAAYAEHAYDEADEEKLWRLSCHAVGMDS